MRHDANTALSLQVNHTNGSYNKKSKDTEHNNKYELCGVDLGSATNMPVSEGGARLTILVTEEAAFAFGSPAALTHSADTAADSYNEGNRESRGNNSMTKRVVDFLHRIFTFMESNKGKDRKEDREASDSHKQYCGADVKCILQSSFLQWAQASIEGDRDADEDYDDDKRTDGTSGGGLEREAISISMQCAFSHVSIVTDKLTQAALSQMSSAATGGSPGVADTTASSSSSSGSVSNSNSNSKNIEAAGQQSVVKKVTTKTTKKRGYGPAVSRVRTVNVRHVDILPNSKLLSARYQQIERELYTRAAARAIEDSSSSSKDGTEEEPLNNLLDNAIAISTKAVVHSMLSPQPKYVY